MSNKLDKILAEISAGELFDKITILEIKKEKISNKEKLIDIEKSESSPKVGMEKAFQAVVDLLTEAKLGYNEFIFSLGV